MFVVVVFLEAEGGRQEELADALRVHARACREREAGCQRYDISVDPLEGAAFLLYQIYDDERPTSRTARCRIMPTSACSPSRGRNRGVCSRIAQSI